MAVDYSAKKNSFVYRLQQQSVALLDVLDATVAIAQEWNDAGYAAGGPAEIVDADLVGGFPSLVAADLADAINSFTAFDGLRSSGHGVNLERLRP